MKAGSNLERVLAAGHFAVCAEMGPPQSADPGAIIKKCDYFRGVADAVNLTDNQTAIVRMSSVAASALLVQQGLDPIMQMTCRDRNRIAMQSDILGASALGIKNILCLSGDFVSFGNHPDAKPVYDIDSIHLVSMVKTLRDERKFFCGEEIKSCEPRMFIGAAANPFAEPHSYRVTRLAKKIAAGADFIQTQCIFDLPRFEQFMAQVRDRGLHEQVYILAGIMPVRSHKALVYMKESVSGMSIPDEMIKRLQQAEDPKEEGVKLCLEIIEQVRAIKGVAGIHLMPVMWESITPRLIKEAGLLPRPVLVEESEPADPAPAPGA